MKHPDFIEGVTARLVSKETPKWQPASLEDIPPDSKIVEPFFQQSGGPSQLNLVTDRSYSEYPYQSFVYLRNRMLKSLLEKVDHPVTRFEKN